MTSYQIEFQWDRDYAIPVLYIIVTGQSRNIGHSLPTLINRTHAYVEQCVACHAVHLVYDITGTPGTLPLNALMRRRPPSPKVKRAAIIGARSRADEMAVLIMAAAYNIPYEYGFFDSQVDALHFLQAPVAAPR